MSLSYLDNEPRIVDQLREPYLQQSFFICLALRDLEQVALLAEIGATFSFS